MNPPFCRANLWSSFGSNKAQFLLLYQSTFSSDSSSINANSGRLGVVAMRINNPQWFADRNQWLTPSLT